MKLLFDENLSPRLVEQLAAEPKIVWLAVGNANTQSVVGLIRAKAEEVNRFGDAPLAALLQLEL